MTKPQYVICFEQKSAGNQTIILESGINGFYPSNETPPVQSRSRAEKPKRPLTAYNIFFQNQRQKILDEIPLPLNQPRRSHGKIGFTELARMVSKRWKVADENTVAKYTALAAEDKKRYLREMKEWKEGEADNEEKQPQKVCLNRHSLQELFSFALENGIVDINDLKQKKANSQLIPDYPETSSGQFKTHFPGATAVHNQASLSSLPEDQGRLPLRHKASDSRSPPTAGAYEPFDLKYGTGQSSTSLFSSLGPDCIDHLFDALGKY